ncbi:response regulator [Mucilaginibacter robiniae]|uniref:histidine kinase n=1 Tax=Mucilaginibacter robiniae TaxID=2728022 RepID=A0A7L5E0E6_9SPHI|nr:two-component regulator propeller domain-containing protein [Mucilaginibacter robiniae]QJD96842.1 response regulator [Mucilaginibacter robiniae]
MKRVLLLKYAFVFILGSVLLCSKESYGLQPVKYLGIEQGLSNNAVTCLFKDAYGFMWIGTYDGLNRYDGEKFKIFRNVWGDAKSLINNHVNTLAGTADKIFIGTQKGLEYYDYSSASFYALSYQPGHKQQRQKISANINALVTDKAGKVYIAADYLGLLVYNNRDKSCHQVALNKSSTAYNVQALTLDHDNRLWLFIKNVGLCWFDAQKNQSNVVNHQLQLASCLLEDAAHNIWVGTESGLYIYNPTSNLVTRFDESYGKLTSNNIVDLKFDQAGKLWIATNGGGINILDAKTHQLNYIVPGREQGTLHSGAISGIYEDNESRKWIATLRGGVNIIDDKSQAFSFFAHDPFNPNSVVNNFILSFCEDEQHNIWIGTDGGGLSYWNTKVNQYTHYTHSADLGSLSSNFVVSVLKDFNHQIWVATFSGGIDAFDQATQRFKHYTCYNSVTKTDDRNLWKLYEDSQHNLWAGTTRGGALYRYNRQQDRFELFDANLTNIHALYEDKAGTLWGANYTQLVRIDTRNKKHLYLNIGYAIRTIAQSKANSLWLGTEGGGLLLYNVGNRTYKRYTQANGLPSNTILNVLVDNHNNLWCSTYNGLTELVKQTGKFINYNASDGLQSNQFNYNAALKLQSGKMLFGGINGFNLFNPDSIKLIAHQPQLRISSLKINNVVAEQSSSYTHQQPLVSLKEITLPYNQATLAVDYTALEYSFPDKINYAYYLEGWDHGWNYVGKLKTAYYTRLNEGKYLLRIKATDTKGNWSNAQLVVAITILPPWYRTWWAYLLYLSVASGIVYWIWLYRTRQEKLKFEIEIANLRVEREKELNEKKLSFFTNVSHEFRTPLTLIINPIKDLLNQNKGNAEELNVIYRNARRLLGLVDHLLLFRKAESENTQMKVSKINFVNLCKEVFMCFSQQVKIKKLSYNLECSSENMEVYADCEKIEIALFNLISNAIKFTPDGGNINILVEEDQGSVYFKITDNGIGISTDVGDKLFDKFYQAKDKNYFKTGFGIGLYLVKVFIENHRGKISYHNNPKGGTTFVLSLPKGKQHFTADQLFENLEFDLNHVHELVDYNNKEAVVKEEETNNLELLISNRQSILVIDDNDQIRSYIKKLFIHDYTVLEADNGKTGIELTKKHLPDLIISDVVMDEISGLELCRIIKQDSAINHIPIILLTGDATPDMMLKSIEEGAVDFLRKPFEKELLIARVKSVLRSKTELQNYFYKEITLKNSTRNISEEHKDFLYNCINIVESNLTNVHFEVDTLARKMGMSYPTLFKRVKAITGQSVNNFVRFVRLRKAAELLIHTNCNVNEAAFQVGFNDLKYFREHFNKQFGVNPSEFIKKHRANFQISYHMHQTVKD